MKVNVCMFVWNHFTNDARVLRACSALAEAGYAVDLIAIHDPKNEELPKKEQYSENFNIRRVNGKLPRFIAYPLGGLGKVKSLLLAHMWLLLLFLVLAAVMVFLFPVVTIFFLSACLILSVRKVRIIFLRTYIFLQMIKHGFKKKYTIYHSNDLNTLPQGIICSKFRLFNRQKLLYDSHEVQTSRTGYTPWFHSNLEKVLIKLTNEIINENHTRAAYTEELYGVYPKVIHNYPFVSKIEQIDKVDLHQLLNIPQTEPILLYQGGIQTGRGLDKIVEAVPLFEKGVVVLIGDGRIKAELKKTVAERNLTKRVRFIQKVPVAELVRYTPNAYLGFQVLNNVCFNHYSASSNKLFEYMMSGVPQVACSFPEIQKVVEKEKTGICVDSHCPLSIAQGVNYLLNHPEERKKMQQNCLRARAHYNWDNEKLEFLRIYKEVMR